MIHLSPLSPSELTDEDALWLVKMAAAGYGMETGEGLLRRAIDGRLQLWRVGGEGEGLLVTRLTRNRIGLTLWLEGVAGRGLVSGRFAFRNAALDLAKALGCRSLSGMVFSTGMKKMVEDTGLTKVGLVFSKEVS